MKRIDVVNNSEFQKAVLECVEKSIDSCNSCGATYDECFLQRKWENRLLEAWSKTCNTAEQLIAYAEKSFAF